MDESQEMPDGGILEAGTGLIGKVSDFYHKAMYRTGGGLRFLRKLGLDDSHLIDSHRLGYCDGSLAKLVTDEKMRVALSHMGLLCAGDGGMVETFKGCVVIPVNDADGGLVALSGIDGRTRKLHMQAGCGISLWNMQAAANYPDILLAEGIMEALSLIEAGYPNTVGIAGQDVSVRDVENLLGLGVGRVTLLASPGRYARPA